MSQTKYSLNFLNVLILACLILSSGIIPFFKSILLMLQVLLFILLMIKIYPLSFTQKDVKNFIFILSVIVIVFIINYLVTIGNHIDSKLYIMYLIYCTNATLLLLYYNKTKKYKFVHDLYFALTFIMYYSLAAFLVQFLIMNKLQPVQSTDEYSVLTFKYIFYYTNNSDLILDTFYRNIGIFWEAGILQLYMNILVFLSLFIFKDKKDKLIAALAGATILTTFSTTGLLILTMQLIVYFFKEIKTNFLWVLFVIAIISFPLYSYLSYNIQEKFTGSNALSSIARARDFDQGLKAITLYPLTGLGIEPEFYKILQRRGELNFPNTFDPAIITLEGNTNSLLLTIAFFGIPLGLMILYMLYKQTLISRHKLLLFIMFLLFVASEPLLLTPFFIVFIISGLWNVLSRKKVYNNKVQEKNHTA